MNRRVVFFPIVLATLLAINAHAADFELVKAGARAGWFETGQDDQFRQYEVFGTLSTPYSFDLGEEWRVDTRIELSAGVLNGAGREAGVFAAGPIAVIARTGRPWRFEIGSRPTAITRHQFGGNGFGGWFQFTSHGSFVWSLGRNLEGAVRIQHLSNARVYSENDGLNMYMLELGWTFQ